VLLPLLALLEFVLEVVMAVDGRLPLVNGYGGEGGGVPLRRLLGRE
jgi:hypothetical protein